MVNGAAACDGLTPAGGSVRGACDQQDEPSIAMRLRCMSAKPERPPLRQAEAALCHFM